MSKNKHGANLFELSEKYNFNLDDILDFSSNINPFGCSKKALEYVRSNLAKVSIYPDPEYKKLLNAVSSYCRINTQNIILGSGATGLISGFINYIKPENAVLVMPAYSEYEAELIKMPDCSIDYHCLRKEDDFYINIDNLIQAVNKNNARLLILCSPNNPTGSIIEKAQIIRLLDNTSCHIMIDETYIEFTDMEQYSAVSLCQQHSRLFIVRSTSKFFAVPGIRLGYGITSNKEFLERYSLQSNLWEINIIASMMGEIMFTDKEFIEECSAKIAAERKYLQSSLAQIAALKVYPSFGNFILCEIISKRIDAAALYDRLISQAIAIRNCSGFKTLGKYFFRICILKPEQNKFLVQKLIEIFS